MNSEPNCSKPSIPNCIIPDLKVIQPDSRCRATIGNFSMLVSVFAPCISVLSCLISVGIWFLLWLQLTFRNLASYIWDGRKITL